MTANNSLLLLALCALVHAPFAAADDGDVFNISASHTSAHDDNFFRLAPTVDHRSFGLESRSETIATTAIGLNMDKTFGVQRLIANVRAADNHYKINEFLNFREFNYDAKWLWSLGVQLTGELAVDRKEALNSFADNRVSSLNAQQGRDVRVTDNERFTINYWFHSSWAAVAGVSRSRLTNEQIGQAESDYEASGYNVGLRYRPASGNTLIARVRSLDGNFAKRQFDPVAQFDNGFRQDSAELDLDWRLTGEGLLRARLEYRKRVHDNFVARDFDGLAGSLDYIYAYSGKGNISLGYKRGLESFQQASSSYYILDEASIAAQWAATSKLSTSARASYGVRSYRGEIVALPAGAERREDKTSRIEFNIAFQAARWLELKAGIAQENRKTNNTAALLDYDDSIGFLSLAAQY